MPSTTTEPLKFHVLPERSEAMLEAFGSITMDQGTIRRMFEEYLRGVIKERFDMLKVDDKIAAHIDRRVEVAVKTVLDRVDTEASVVALKIVRERVAAIVAATPLSVSVSVK